MSVRFSLGEALRWTRGRSPEAEDPALTFSGVSIDTRTLESGFLFVAIRGEKHDAHAFLERAIEGGAGALVLEEDWLAAHCAPTDCPVIAVPDTTRALGDLAAGHRTGFAGPLVAITGSSGKTTTKEMCHSILSREGPCLKNPGNLNNAFGLPLSLLAREPEHRSAVIEMGMNHRGEISVLSSIARPDIGVLTNVGTAHIEFLGSREEIAAEKGDLLAALPAGGVAVINRDDPLAFAQRKRVACRVLTFGLSAKADVCAEGVRFSSEDGYCFHLQTPAGREAVKLRGLAETTVVNALAAAAAGLAAGAGMESIAAGLASHQGVPGRMARHELGCGAHVIDDTYNANPQSMRNALESLARVKGQGRAIAVLGDMGELGASARAAHREAGELVAQLGTDLLFTVGERAGELARAAIGAGMNTKAVSVGQAHEQIARSLLGLLRVDDWVLVKGSRTMHMERVVEDLVTGEKD